MESAANATGRQLVLVIGAVVFVDTMFYAAIAPLLPTLSHELRLSKLSAGVMTAGYPAGTLAGSLPGGVLVAHAGPKRTVYAGLALLAGSTLAFGFLNNAAALDAARFLEGVGGACSWAGGLAWLVASGSPQRRGALIGGALGAAIFGELFGPVIGTLAGAIGRGPAFSAVVVFALVLIEMVRRLPAAPAPSGQGLGALRHAFRDRRLSLSMWLVTLPALVSGLINVLGPLRMHRLGATAAAIGATYLAAAALDGAITPAIGKLSDRRGRDLPLRFGLAGATVLLVCFSLPGTAVLLAVLIVLLIAALGGFWAPALALLADVAETRGLDPGLAAALMNLTWGLGVFVGSGAGGAIAKGTGDAVPMILAAGLCAATLIALLRPRGSLE
jgi:MFS family permease